MSQNNTPQGNQDNINHPQHYGGNTTYEAIKVIEAHNLGFHLGNVVKYVLRAGKKDAAMEIQDLKKAMWYLSKKLDLLEPAPSASALPQLLTWEQAELAAKDGEVISNIAWPANDFIKFNGGMYINSNGTRVIPYIYNRAKANSFYVV